MKLAFRTKNLAVYEELRQNIVEGKLKPGQRLVMSEIAARYGLSEIPVREAIRSLESEGFVTFTPHVGAVVTQINEGEFVEIYLIRIELEALATRLAVPHISERDVEFLKKLNREMKTAVKQGSYEKLGRLNKEFHLKIYHAAPYPLLNKMLKDLWDKAERTQSVFAFVPERAEASIIEHEEIIAALAVRNVSDAEALMKQQKTRTMAVLQRYLYEAK
jgi:DNA-binding GntR family transcriptional regulator